MRLEKSPSLDDYKNGLPERPTDPAAGRKQFRIVLLIVMLFVLFLSGANLMRSRTGGLLTGTGTVKGAVIDQNGAPFQGRIFVLGTKLATTTDADGRFQLDRVPAGAQFLVVADNLVGREIPVQVVAGQAIDIGRVQFMPTATP